MRTSRRLLTFGQAVALALALPVSVAEASDAFEIQKYIVSARYLHQETLDAKGRADDGPPCNVRRRWTHNGFFQEKWERARVRAVVRDLPGKPGQPRELEVGIGPGVQPFPLGIFTGIDEDRIRTTYTVTASGGGDRVVKRPRTGIPECDHETEDRRSKVPTDGCGTFEGKGELGLSLTGKPFRRKGKPDSVRFSFGLLEPGENEWGGYPPGFEPLRDPERSYCPGHRRAERGLEEKAMYATMPVREMAAKPRPWSAFRYQTYTIKAKIYAPGPDPALYYPVKVRSGWVVSFVPVKASRAQCREAVRQLRAQNLAIGTLRDLTEKEAREAVEECVQGRGLSEVWDTDDGWADEP